MMAVATGCATRPRITVPLSAKINERVEIRSVHARVAKDGVTVEGFARRRSFGTLPRGSHLHVVAFRKYERQSVEADASWHPPVRHRTLIAYYRANLQGIEADEIARIDIEFRDKRD